MAGTGNSGSQINQVANPWHLTLDSSGALYVADSGNNRISKWTGGSLTPTIVAGQASASSGSGSASLNQPYGIYVDPNKNIYVADTNNHRVQFWSNGASTGITVAGVNGKKTEKKDLC